MGVVSGRASMAADASSADLSNTPVPLATTVTDRDGTPIAMLYAQYRVPVAPQQISPAMNAAIISIEDRRFYQDNGVDMRGMLRAVLHDSAGGGGSVQGASTITQQYVKNYLINVIDRNDPAAQHADQADTAARKLREAKMAVQLARTMPKPDILAGYLNLVEFTGNIYGVGAAAQAYFGTTADKLTVPQSALLAGMVNNPNLFDPYNHPQQALQRRNEVIDSMVQGNVLSPQDGAAAKAASLGVVPDGPITPSSTCMGANPDAGFLCQYAERYLQQAGFTPDQLATGGYTIKTTLDPRVSQAAKNAVDANVSPTQDGVANSFAVVQPGQAGHQVLAMVSNRSYGTDASQGGVSTNIVADASNVFGAGSSFKIFTTAAALESGKAGLNTPLPDPPSGCFTPPNTNRYTSCYPVKNDENAPNPISIADALAISPNTAFVDLESRVGMPQVVQMAYRLGLRNTLQTNDAGGTPITNPSNRLSSNSQYNQPQSQYFQDKLSFTLGNSPVSPMEMANVVATLKSGGVWCPPNPVLSVTDRKGDAVPVPQQPCEQVVSPGVANTVQAGLSKDTVSGTSAAAAKAARWTRPDIGKTGTTEESESVAFVGGVDDYAVASMVFASGSHPQEVCPGPPVHLGDCGAGAFGGTVAAPPYFQSMNQLLAGQPNQPVPAPDPAYVFAGIHGPIVPYVVGQQAAVAETTVQRGGYSVRTQNVDSALPSGQVVGQTPQGNVAWGTQVTLYVSNGRIKPGS
jgi:membrane peptidoglycan carboxypeptidase